MLELIALGVMGTIGYIQSRRFVRERLRFVDSVQSPAAPFMVGTVTALAAAPLVWLLPIVGGVTAVGLGIAVGAGVAAGARDARRLPGA